MDRYLSANAEGRGQEDMGSGYGPGRGTQQQRAQLFALAASATRAIGVAAQPRPELRGQRRESAPRVVRVACTAGAAARTCKLSEWTDNRATAVPNADPARASP